MAAAILKSVQFEVRNGMCIIMQQVFVSASAIFASVQQGPADANGEML